MTDEYLTMCQEVWNCTRKHAQDAYPLTRMGVVVELFCWICGRPGMPEHACPMPRLPHRHMVLRVRARTLLSQWTSLHLLN
jgi:hypothetical protein